jgi:hypothetical protein
MKKWINPALVLLIMILSNCSKFSLEKEWYLSGGDIRLFIDLKKEKVIRFSEGEKLIFEAAVTDYKVTEENRVKINAAIKKIGQKKEYQLKFSRLENFILWLEVGEKQMKLIFNSFYKKPYYFTTYPSSGKGPSHRFLSEYEVETFKNAPSFQDIQKDHNLEIISNKSPAMTEEEVIQNEKRGIRTWLRKQYGVGNRVIRNMTDYMIDKDFSTYWATQPGNFWNTEMEFFLKTSSGKKLKKPLPVRALYFNTGNIDRYIKGGQYIQHHRAKDITVSFSRDYEGGLGSSKANYNEVKYSFTLPDTNNEKVIVFLEPIPATSLRIEFEDFYMGYENAFALYDFSIIIDSD